MQIIGFHGDGNNRLRENEKPFAMIRNEDVIGALRGVLLFNVFKFIFSSRPVRETRRWTGIIRKWV